MQKPKVSVLLSVYNAEKTIARAVKSILGQNYDDFELVVVNDGSTDDTPNILNRFGNNKLRVYQGRHKGLPLALNFGLTKCKGQYIARMDADDWSYPNRLKLQAAFLDTHPQIDVVSSLVEYEGNRKNNMGYALHVDWMNALVTHDQIQKKRFEDSPIANPSTMFRRSIIDQHGAYSEEANIPEDYEFWLRLMHHGIRFHKLGQVLLKWQDHPGRATRNLSQYSQESFQKVKALYLSQWVKKNFESAPQIYVFGYGKAVREKTKFLSSNGLTIHKYIDIRPHNDTKEIIYYKDLPNADSKRLVLSFIGDREGKQEIIQFLTARGYEEGKHFFMMA